MKTKVSPLRVFHSNIVSAAVVLFSAKKALLPHIRRDMIDFYRIPVSQINNIKLGANWVDEEGQTVLNSRLVTPSAPARAYAYCSDTRYMPELHKAVQGVDVLYHEATYDAKNGISSTTLLSQHSRRSS